MTKWQKVRNFAASEASGNMRHECSCWACQKASGSGGNQRWQRVRAEPWREGAGSEGAAEVWRRPNWEMPPMRQLERSGSELNKTRQSTVSSGTP